MGITSSDREARMSPPGALMPARVTARMGPPGSPSGIDALKDSERNQRLREVRDEVQGLRSALEGVRKGETTVGDLGDYIERARVEIDALMKATPGADPVRRVATTWDQVQASALIQNPRVPIDAQSQLHHLNMIDTLCKKLVFQVGQITIPERVNEWLRLARPGYYIPFHTVFEDELPDFEDRVKVLNYLAWAPKVLEGGLVNVEGGLIYRYSQDPVQRLLTLGGALLAFLGAGSLVAGACYLPLPDWPLRQTHLAIMLIGWMAVLMGVIVHTGVATAKRAQAEGGRPPIVAPEDALLWINARFGNIVLKMLMALIGFFALAFTAGVDKVTPFSMFLVGYSLDSVVEVFGSSLEQRASNPAATLKRQLSVQPEL